MRGLAVLAALMVAFAVLATSTAAQPPGSKILDVSRVQPDPGLIDVLITDLEYDADSRTVSVTGTVVCNAPFVSVVFVDYRASQTRGNTTEGVTTTESNPCGEPVRAVVEPGSGESFRPGRATIEIAAFACGRGCTVEVLRAEVVLIPERAAS